MEAIASFWLLCASKCLFNRALQFFVMLHILFVSLHVLFVSLHILFVTLHVLVFVSLHVRFD